MPSRSRRRLFGPSFHTCRFGKVKALSSFTEHSDVLTQMHLFLSGIQKRVYLGCPLDAVYDSLKGREPVIHGRSLDGDSFTSLACLMSRTICDSREGPFWAEYLVMRGFCYSFRCPEDSQVVIVILHPTSPRSGAGQATFRHIKNSPLVA